MSGMEFSATDNFGNLLVGESSSTTLDQLRSDLELMCESLLGRHDGEIALSIDVSFNEISGPNGDQVSHRMIVPWFESRVSAGESEDVILDEVKGLAEQVANEKAPGRFTIQGPWDF
jgi:hypothetical protein